MSQTQDFDQLIRRYHQALGEFVRGNPEPQKEMFSRREDITLANPFGGIRCGREPVLAELDHASSFYKDGQIIGYENAAKYVTAEVAFIVEIERYAARFADSQEITPRDIRVTSIFRREDGEWKLLHRQADPLVSPQLPWSSARR